MRVAVLNGPNLNLLGAREPHIYGRLALTDIERMVRARADQRGIEVSWHQTNHEGEFVDLIQALPASADGALIEWQIEDLPLEELIEWTYANRYVRELTCEERETYRIAPLCDQ